MRYFPSFRCWRFHGNWSGTSGNTGTSIGSIIILRGDNATGTRNMIQNAKFIRGEKKTYNRYIKQLLSILPEKTKRELMGEIKSYFDDLFNVGNEYVIKYTGKEAQNLWQELQKQFQ